MKYTTVDKTHYGERTYFNEDIRGFKDLENSFPKYRISKVLQIYTPSRDERVLDLGCGFRTFCFAVAPLCREVVGLDSSKGNIDLCNKLLAKSQYTNIKFVCSDVQDIQLQSGSYDVIICADFLNTNTLKFLKEF
jgi:2-polyprenyl-3-methyl-5-hydroxy-6-metoxy-1,4-benzoquinol methylase